MDESGTPELSGNTSHFILAGLVIPIWHWADADRSINDIKSRYGLRDQELHAAWMLRPYLEQESIVGFETMDIASRRSAVQRARVAELHKLQRKPHGHKAYKQAQKNFKKSEPYIHLTLAQRQTIAQQVTSAVGGWGFARLFAECIDKHYFDPVRNQKSVGEQGFEQIITRFESYLGRTSIAGNKAYGVVVHDNNATVALKHTAMMRHFHTHGTLWTRVGHIIETPLFVDSTLTSMVQVADLCSYALRRYCENGEEDLMSRIFPRGDKIGNNVVGLRHFSPTTCACRICRSHSH